MSETPVSVDLPISGIKTPFGVSREVPLQHFLHRILPQLPHGLNPAQVLETIKTSSNSSSQKILTKHGRWRGFAKDPALCDRSVYRTFTHLEGVVKAVIQASSSSARIKPELNFKNNPGPITTYELRSRNTLPDAFLLEGEEHAWKHIAVCGEYQRENTPDCVENVSYTA